MKNRYLYVLVITICLVITMTACELRRTNPLDPNNTESVVAPPRVTGLTAAGSGSGILNKYAELTWTRNIVNTDGYYIYMGLAYNSAYARVDTLVGNVSTSTVMSRIISMSSPGFYYFKVSAYKTYPAGNLEGSLSEWAIAHIEN